MNAIDTKLLSITENIIAKEGYSAFSMERLEEESGFGKAFHFSLFSKKNLLFYTIVTNFYESAAKASAFAFSTELPEREALRQYIRAFLEYVFSHPTQALSAFLIGKNFRDEEGALVFEPEKFALCQPLIEVVERCPNYLFPPPLMAELIQTIVCGIASELVSDPQLDSETVVRKSMVLFDFLTNPPEAKA